MDFRECFRERKRLPIRHNRSILHFPSLEAGSEDSCLHGSSYLYFFLSWRISSKGVSHMRVAVASLFFYDQTS